MQRQSNTRGKRRGSAGTKESTLTTDAFTSLAALEHLLAGDLSKATKAQVKTACAAFLKAPGHDTLVSAVERWAEALANECRRHARDCVRIHATANGPDSARSSAMGTIERLLAHHLRLPDGRLASPWPPSNRVREFVLQITGAPVEYIDGKFVPKAILPRVTLSIGERLARNFATCSPGQPVSENDKFLSVEDTDKKLPGLEESFREKLLDELQSSYSEIVLADRMNDHAGPQSSRKPGPQARQDPCKIAIAAIKAANPKLTTREICLKMDKKMEYDKKLRPPHSWDKSQTLWTDFYDDRRTRNRVSVYISKIK